MPLILGHSDEDDETWMEAYSNMLSVGLVPPTASVVEESTQIIQRPGQGPLCYTSTGSCCLHVWTSHMLQKVERRITDSTPTSAVQAYLTAVRNWAEKTPSIPSKPTHDVWIGLVSPYWAGVDELSDRAYTVSIERVRMLVQMAPTSALLTVFEDILPYPNRHREVRYIRGGSRLHMQRWYMPHGPYDDMPVPALDAFLLEINKRSALEADCRAALAAAMQRVSPDGSVDQTFGDEDQVKVKRRQM